ncbi:MAG: ABC transporter permease [Oscillospiraceae bacterium]|jgi:ABC-2 type transport system permease protein|nr:ABC transporter permease [Oscillospiraceae bacterium]
MAGNGIGMRRLLRLYALYARMDWAWLRRDTRLGLLVMGMDLLTAAASASAVFLLAWRFDGVGGMNRWDVLFMLGYVVCVHGLCVLFFSNNVGHVSRRIARGQFDHMMVQPLPYAVQLLTEGFAPFTAWQGLACGLGVMAWALNGLGRVPGALWLLGLAGYLLLSLAVVIGMSYLLGALAFRWPVACEEISSTVVDDLFGVLANYPLSAMPGAVRMALLTVAPAGLMGWFPACALLGKPPLGLPALYPLLAAGVIWGLAAFAFRKGLKYYAKTGSTRYRSYGHR